MRRAFAMPYRRPSPCPVRLDVAARTETGPRRMNNEDTFLVVDLAGGPRHGPAPFAGVVESAGGVGLAVIDGMGGQCVGDVPAGMTADALARALGEGLPDGADAALRCLGAILGQASAAVFQASARQMSLRGIGATATVAAIVGDRLLLAQVGDTRAYVLRGERLAQVTRDHSLVHEYRALGATAEQLAAVPANVVTRAIGVKETVEPDLSIVALRAGDVLLLCSDGLHGEIGDDAVARILRASPAPADACDALVAAATRAGGRDNITVVVTAVESDGLRPPAPEDALEDRNLPVWKKR